jgi:transposase
MTETQRTWSERVRDWRASGKSAEEYAEGREFKASTLRYWASHLRRVTSAEAAATVREAPIRMVQVVSRPTAAAIALEVHVGPARVVVRQGFDPGLLRQVVEALGASA